jgi:serine/threonine-protein kinase RsbW
MTQDAHFPNDTSSIAAARRFVADALRDLEAATRDRATLLVSEISTNAVKHAQSNFAVTVIADGPTVRVEVRDFGHGQPTLRDPPPAEPTGRGLLIVSAMSDGWGVETHSDGKTVWFALVTSRDASPPTTTSAR